MTSPRQGVSSGHAHSVTAGSLFLQGEVKTKHTLRLSHMSLSSRSCAFLRLANIVSFVSKIYSRLPIRTDVVKIRGCYARPGKVLDTIDRKFKSQHRRAVLLSASVPKQRNRICCCSCYWVKLNYGAFSLTVVQGALRSYTSLVCFSHTWCWYDLIGICRSTFISFKVLELGLHTFHSYN